MSNYPYIGQLSPAVGGGLGGLPRRKCAAVTDQSYKDPYIQWVSFLSGFEDTITGNVISGKSTASAVGSPVLIGAPVKFGKLSLSLPTSSDRLAINPSVFTTFSGDFTVEGYFFNSSFVTKGLFGGDADQVGRFRVDESSGYLQCEAYGYGTTSTAPLPTANDWNHVALCRKNGVMKLYTNGVCATFTGADTSATTMNNNQTLLVGKNYTAANFAGGFVDDFRVTNGVARYDGNFSTPSQSFLG